MNEQKFKASRRLYAHRGDCGRFPQTLLSTCISKPGKIPQPGKIGRSQAPWFPPSLTSDGRGRRRLPRRGRVRLGPLPSETVTFLVFDLRCPPVSKSHRGSNFCGTAAKNAGPGETVPQQRVAAQLEAEFAHPTLDGGIVNLLPAPLPILLLHILGLSGSPALPRSQMPMCC